MIDYSLILTKKYSGEWTLNGNDYDQLVWLSNSPKPSKEELDNLWEDVLLEIENKKIDRETKQAALLDKLGITKEEIALLLS